MVFDADQVLRIPFDCKCVSLTDGTLMEHLIERTILTSRWLPVPLYFGLIAVLAILVVKFGQELAIPSVTAWGLQESNLIHTILTLVDIMLVTNLAIMIRELCLADRGHDGTQQVALVGQNRERFDRGEGRDLDRVDL